VAGLRVEFVAVRLADLQEAALHLGGREDVAHIIDDALLDVISGLRRLAKVSGGLPISISYDAPLALLRLLLAVANLSGVESRSAVVAEIVVRGLVSFRL